MTTGVKNTIQSAQAVTSHPRLETITKPLLTTKEAAFYLNRTQQTLRCWAMNQKSTIDPIRLNGRLAWPVVAIKKVLGVQ